MVEDPDCWGGQDQAVYAIEHAAVAREQAAGIFDGGAAFVGGFDQVAGLTCDVGDSGDYQQGDDVGLHPFCEEDGYEHGG